MSLDIKFSIAANCFFQINNRTAEVMGIDGRLMPKSVLKTRTRGIRIRKDMTKEIKALPDKELDLDLQFEVRTQSKRLPYEIKI